MYATKMFENIAEDRRAETIAMANAVGIGFGGDKAYQSWLQDQDKAPAVKDEAALRQQATILRLQSLYGSQRNKGLRSAIKIRKPD